MAEQFAHGLKAIGETIRVPGGLGPAVEVDPAAVPVAAFIGLTGRDPSPAALATNRTDRRPLSWIGHIGPIAVTDLDASIKFYLAAGMQMAVDLEGAAILEMRGGTHLIIAEGLNTDGSPGGQAPFDLMVDNIDKFRQTLLHATYSASEITEDSNHRSFVVTDPSGWTINVDDSHVVGPV